MKQPDRGPWISLIMGSKSDYPTLEPAVALLGELEVPYEARVVSAHRTPDLLGEFAASAEERGVRVIIAAAGGAAHLPGMMAAHTLIPVLGVPVPCTDLKGVDALLSIVQMPKGVPVGTLALGTPGAVNAALLGAQMIATTEPELRQRLRDYRRRMRDAVLAQELP